PSSFRCMLLGGSGASSGLLERAKSKYVPVFQSYGMTETSSQIVTLSPDNALKKIGSSGKSLFPASVEIRDQGSDGIGEIYVKGPMVTSGYYNNESATQEAIKNGWLRTGDLGYMDGEGFLYVVDRRKDLIISGGENIYPSEIEAVLLRIDGIKEAAVAGMDDDEWGKVPFACVVGDESKVSREYILYRLKASLASFKVPKKIIFVPSLPRNSSRKILRKSLLTYVKQKKMV
ncbi:MAG TPA: AMP-binding protein, partial [Bacillota bacterium]|nr:AMP-binding protein [Bacillota bacterium]